VPSRREYKRLEITPSDYFAPAFNSYRTWFDFQGATVWLSLLDYKQNLLMAAYLTLNGRRCWQESHGGPLQHLQKRLLGGMKRVEFV